MRGRSAQRGFLLIAALVVVVIFVVLGTALALVMSTTARTGAEQHTATQAFYAAESGLDWAAREMQYTYDDHDFDTFCAELDVSDPPDILLDGAVLATVELTAGPDQEDEGCYVQFEGESGESVRRVGAVLPFSLLVEATNLFDYGFPPWDGENYQWTEGVLTLEEPPSGHGESPQRPRPRGRYSGAWVDWADVQQGVTFGSGNHLFLAMFLEDAETLTGSNTLAARIWRDGDDIECEVPVTDLDQADCGEVPPAEEVEALQEAGYNIVFYLGDDVTSASINEIEFSLIDWVDSFDVSLSAACLGTVAHCDPEASNPTDGESWEEG